MGVPGRAWRFFVVHFSSPVLKSSTIRKNGSTSFILDSSGRKHTYTRTFGRIHTQTHTHGGRRRRSRLRTRRSGTRVSERSKFARHASSRSEPTITCHGNGWRALVEAQTGPPCDVTSRRWVARSRHRRCSGSRCCNSRGSPRRSYSPRKRTVITNKFYNSQQIFVEGGEGEDPVCYVRVCTESYGRVEELIGSWSSCS